MNSSSSKTSNLSKIFRSSDRNTKTKSTTSTNATVSLDRKKADKQRKIDAILDKISKSGYESLSKEEKDFLFIAGKED